MTSQWTYLTCSFYLKMVLNRYHSHTPKFKRQQKKMQTNPNIKWTVPPVTVLQLFRPHTQKHPWISMYSSRGILYIYKQICLYILPQMVAMHTNVLHIFHVTIYFASFHVSKHRTTSFFSMAAYEWFQTVPSFIYPVPCWWTFRLLHSSAITNNAE